MFEVVECAKKKQRIVEKRRMEQSSVQQNLVESNCHISSV